MATQLKAVEDSSRDGTLSERIAHYLPELHKHAAATEKARMARPEAIEAAREAGFFRAFVPKSRGGDDRSLLDYIRGIRTMASACPSTAWAVGVLSVHTVAVANMTRKVQDEFWATGPDTIASSSGSPIIKAERVEGGALVSGRGRWSSGCDHAHWVQLGFKLPNAANRQYPEHRYTDIYAMVPKSDYTIDDTWYSTGMRGSGSKDIVLDKVFVPDYRMEVSSSLQMMTSKGYGTNDAWHRHSPFGFVFAAFVPSVALGCADGMLTEYAKRQKTRKNAYTGAQGILSAPGYMRLAESTHDLEAITAFTEKLVERIEHFASTGEPLTEAAFMDILPRYPYICRRVTELVDRLMQGAGSSAIADFNPMQRYWRDAKTCSLHLGMDYDINAQMYGRHLLGLGFDPNL